MNSTPEGDCVNKNSSIHMIKLWELGDALKCLIKEKQLENKLTYKTTKATVTTNGNGWTYNEPAKQITNRSKLKTNPNDGALNILIIFVGYEGSRTFCWTD